MADGGSLDGEVDLSAPEPAPAGGASGPAADAGRRRRPTSRRRRRALAAAVVAAALVVAGAALRREGARDAAAVVAQERSTAAEASLRSSAQERAAGVRSTGAAVSRALELAAPGAGQPAWGPPDLAGEPAAGAPVDLQVLGAWSGDQRIGYRLVTGMPPDSGLSPCRAPLVRIGTWLREQDGGSALPCRVMASGARGTAVLTGPLDAVDLDAVDLDAVDLDAVPAGAPVPADPTRTRLEVREVVLVSGGRTASVAVWAAGGAEPVLDVPALGALAAALIATAEPT